MKKKYFISFVSTNSKVPRFGNTVAEGEPIYDQAEIVQLQDWLSKSLKTPVIILSFQELPQKNIIVAASAAN